MGLHSIPPEFIPIRDLYWVGPNNPCPRLGCTRSVSGHHQCINEFFEPIAHMSALYCECHACMPQGALYNTRTLHYFIGVRALCKYCESGNHPPRPNREI